MDEDIDDYGLRAGRGYLQGFNNRQIRGRCQALRGSLDRRLLH